MSDRTIHAELADLQLVRYGKAGAWYCEKVKTNGSDDRIGAREKCTIKEAVAIAVRWHKNGGKIHLKRSGGLQFDARFLRMVGPNR